jgi:hypothetical protein
VSAVLAAGGLVAALGACGDDAPDDPRAELADRLVDDAGFEIDAECVATRTDGLSEADARFLLDNFDAGSTADFGDELEGWIDGLFDCVVGADDTAGDESADPAALVACMEAAGFPLVGSESMDDEMAEGLGITAIFVLDVERTDAFGSVAYYDSIGRAEADVQSARAAASDDQEVGRVGLAVFAVEADAGDAVRGCLEP